MGAKIRQLRDAADLSQMELGARAGMHHNYVGILERGEVANPGLATVHRIAVGLRTSIAPLARAFVQAGLPQTGSLTPTPRARRVVASGGPKRLGHGLALLRTTAGLTQLGLAKTAGMHRAYLGSLEAGAKQNPGLATITRIVESLDFCTDEIAIVVGWLAQVFAGEISTDAFRAALSSRASGRAGRRSSPQDRSAH
jgi:transcriptional regulator with XRE-family HTH domain